jgi:hypothetical protein
VKVKKIPIEIRDCTSREEVELALRDGVCVRMGRLAAMVGPYWSLGFYVDWEGDGAVAGNDAFVLEAERIYASGERRGRYERAHSLTVEQQDHYYGVASDSVWRWHVLERMHDYDGSSSVADPGSILKDLKCGGSPMKRATEGDVTSLLKDMRYLASFTNAAAKVAAATTAPAAVVEHAVFEHAVWMTSQPAWRLDPETLWPLTDDRSVKDVVFALEDNKVVIVRASVLRSLKRVIGRRPGLRSTVDGDGLHIRWGESGGFDLRDRTRDHIRWGDGGASDLRDSYAPNGRVEGSDKIVVPLTTPTYKAA